jgi:hypothetical protein
MLGDFNAKAGRESIFKPTIGNKSLHAVSNGNGVRVVSFATTKNLIVKSTIFPLCNIRKFTWTSRDKRTNNQIVHFLIDRRRHSSVPDVRPFRVPDCYTDLYLVVEKFRERLAVSKRTTQKFDMERLNHKKLDEIEGKEQYRVEMSIKIALWKT